jgi:hypothetical protein
VRAHNTRNLSTIPGKGTFYLLVNTLVFLSIIFMDESF